MELLTSDGWSSVYTIEAVTMQISSTLVRGGGRIRPQNKVQLKSYPEVFYTIVSS